MKKHFKYFIILIFFCILPIVLIQYVTRTYIKFKENKIYDNYFLKSSKILRELKDKINSDSIKTNICSDVVYELSNLQDLTPANVKEIEKKFEKKYPELLTIVVLKNLDVNNCIKMRKLKIQKLKIPLSLLEKNIRDRVKLIKTKRLKYQITYKFLGKYLLDYAKYLSLEYYSSKKIFNQIKKPKIARGKFKLVEKVIGSNYKPIYLATKRTSLHILPYMGKKSFFYWNVIKNKVKFNEKFSSEVISGIVFIFINESVYKKSFSLEKILAMKKREINDTKLHLNKIFLDNDKSLSKLIKKEPDLKNKIKKTNLSITKIIGKNFLYTTILVRETDYLMIIAKKSKVDCFPNKNHYILWLNILSLIFFSFFVILSFLIHYNYINPFISVKWQIISLFMIASLIPLFTIFFLGFNYISNVLQNSEKDIYKEIETNIYNLDDELISYLGNLQYMANSFIKKKCVLNVDIPKIKPILDKYKEKDLIDHYYIFDSESKLLLTDREKKGIEYMSISLINQIVVSYMKTGSLKLKSSGDSKDDTLKNMVIDRITENDNVSTSGWNNTLITQRHKIHQISLLSLNLILFAEPILDKFGDPTASVSLIFDLKTQRKKIIDNFQKKIESGKNQKFKFLIWDTSDNKLVNNNKNEKYSGELYELIRKVEKTNIPQEELLEINGKKMLVKAVHLKEIKRYIIVGLYPYRKIEELFYKNLNLFILLLLLIFIVAIFISIMISRKFIKPVKDLENGVKEITNENYSFRMQINSNDEFGELSNTFNDMTTSIQEKIRMSRYVSDFVLDEIKKDDKEFKAGGEEKKVTILFSDIRSFTTMSETHPPSEIVEMLNEYLEIMTSVIQKHGGVIDKFIGDAIMAVFHPIHKEHNEIDEIRALKAAIDMRETLAEFNRRRKEKGLFEIDNGIGINSGTVIQGNIGSKDYRIDLTVIGDNVNLAARLESVSKEGKYMKIILSETTYKKVKELVEVVPMGERKVKGKTKGVQIYEVVKKKYR